MCVCTQVMNLFTGSGADSRLADWDVWLVNLYAALDNRPDSELTEGLLASYTRLSVLHQLFELVQSRKDANRIAWKVHAPPEGGAGMSTAAGTSDAYVLHYPELRRVLRAKYDSLPDKSDMCRWMPHVSVFHSCGMNAIVVWFERLAVIHRRLTENEISGRLGDISTKGITTDTLIQVVDGPDRNDGESIVYMTPMKADRFTKVDFDFAMCILVRASPAKIHDLVMAGCTADEMILRGVHVFLTGREVVTWPTKAGQKQQYLVMNNVETRCAILAEVCMHALHVHTVGIR